MSEPVKAIDVYPTHYGLTDRLVEELINALPNQIDSLDQVRAAFRPIVGGWITEWRRDEV